MINLKWPSFLFFETSYFFFWVYFLKFHYKLILLRHNINKSSKISFHERRKIGRDWIANVTKCIFVWFKHVDVFWRDDKKKGKSNSQSIVNWAESSAYFYEKKFYFSYHVFRFIIFFTMSKQIVIFSVQNRDIFMLWKKCYLDDSN